MNLVQGKTDSFYSSVSLLDSLLSYKIDSTTFIENEAMVRTLCDSIDKLNTKEQGYLLFEIAIGSLSALKLIIKNHGNYTVRSWTTTQKIEKPISIIIHEEGNKDLNEVVEKITDNHSVSNNSETFTYLLAESLTGYCISEKNLTDHCEFLSQNHKEVKISRDSNIKYKEAWDMYDFFTGKVSEITSEIRSTITDYVSRLNCDKLNCTINVGGIDNTQFFGVAKIVKVKQVGNTRTFQITLNKLAQTGSACITLIGSRNAGVKSDSLNIKPIGNLAIAEIREYYGDGDGIKNALVRLPYEFLDEGRTLLGINRGSYWNLIIGPDQKAQEENATDNIKRILAQYIDTVLKKTLAVNASIKDGSQTYNILTYEDAINKEQRDIKPMQLKLKAIKRMLDEYQYIGKKEKAKGKDVTVTDKIKYNHTNGEVSYNDFSFAVDDEMIKNSFMDMFNHYIVEYYRNALSEEAILNDILAKIFDSIKSRLNSYSKDTSLINIKLNHAVDIKLEIKSSKNSAKLIYINGQRFNKNEVITVLKEMTCYRNQQEADMFIKNIGKLGLSVYIAISTGYEVKFKNKTNGEEAITRIFKFRKNKGRSNYSLILDTVEIDIVGKTLINTLYSQFIGDYVPDFDRKIPKFIMDSVHGSLDYAKYKFLIDSTYEAFQKNSVDFLTKKVADVGGKFCKYYNNKNNKILDAIEIVGLTGTTYVITYDKTNSWVFLNPEVKEEGVYKDGKYVCMIDQSNIKSNIGYDTVIAKLMALKNDSVIASKIYNLKEELDD